MLVESPGKDFRKGYACVFVLAGDGLCDEGTR